MTMEPQASPEVTSSTPQPSTASTPSPAPSQEASKSTPHIAQSNTAIPQKAAIGDPAAESETPAWEPNLKYKVGKIEKEFNPLIKDLVKSAEHEKHLRDLYERADGLEVVKMSREQYKKHLDSITQEYEPVKKELKQLGVFLQNNDFDSAFGLLGLSEQKIIDYVATKLQYKQMSPEERARVDAQKGLQQKNYQQLSEVETLRKQLAETEVNTLQFQVSVLQESPKFASAQEIFDSRVGTPGAFMHKFLEIGDYLTQRNGGKIVPANEVLNIVLKEYGLDGANSSQTMAPAPQQKTVVTAPPAQPTIKNLSGSKTATPVKSKPRSIEDLKKLQREMSGSRFEEGVR